MSASHLTLTSMSSIMRRGDLFNCDLYKATEYFFLNISAHERSLPDWLTSIILPGLRTPGRFLQQAVVPSVNNVEFSVCGWGYSKAVPLAWQRLITHTASVFAPKWGAAPLAGPSCQGDPTCPRMAGRQAGAEGEGTVRCVFIAPGHRMLAGTLGPG